MNFPWNPKLFRWMSLRCKKIPDMYENNNLNHHPGFHMFYINLMFPSIVFHVFFPYFLTSSIPGTGFSIRAGSPLQVQVPGGQALSSVEAQQLSTTARDVGKPQPGGRMGKLDQEKWWNMMEIQVHEIWDPLFSSKKPRYPNVQSTT